MAIKDRIKGIARTVIPLVQKALHPGRSAVEPVWPPKRILVLNSGHIGDIIITTSIVPILQSAYPGVEIGFAVGSWCAMVLKGNPAITHVHCIDHWSTNRSGKSFFAKLKRYRATRYAALREMRNVGYDMALCVRPSLSDLLDLAWDADIPIRAGFRDSVLAGFATHLADLPTNPFMHQSTLQAEVLRPFGVEESHLQMRKATLSESSADAVREVTALLGVPGIEDTKYLIVHMGAGALNKELPPEFWHEVASALSQRHVVLFTGRGDRESANIAQAMAGLENCVNACDKLSWEGFVAAVRHAEALYGVDSMTGHVAAATGTRCVMAYTGTGGVARWRPETPLTTVFSKHLACAPCGKARGCKEMTCIRKITPADLLQAEPKPHHVL